MRANTRWVVRALALGQRILRGSGALHALRAAHTPCAAPSVPRPQDELSGADIKAMCTEAGLLALRERRMCVTQEDFKKAKEKVGGWAGGWALLSRAWVGGAQRGVVLIRGLQTGQGECGF